MGGSTEYATDGKNDIICENFWCH